MSFERQIQIPASFLALYTPSGHARPTPPRQWLEDRHDLCEDLSQLLAEKVKDKVWQLGITESDALLRIERGLPSLNLEMNDAERQWVMIRVQEILGQ
ncbi:ATPase with chaperone activity [Orrella daihaiensis]|uniref:ATPase with chaperone activity n=1 Tax=Orrella daihaiensis TaxID=2782176 RepID=A0ABY4ANK3_9BURK|nr:ATPase with chaperone activity [Orrella daihaiensis]UOD50635.1 ATPase with chaperone activity [Orrella daihaiensis]